MSGYLTSGNALVTQLNAAGGPNILQTAVRTAAERAGLIGGSLANSVVTTASDSTATHQIEVEIDGQIFYLLAKTLPPQGAWPRSQTFTPDSSVVSNALSLPALRTPVTDPTFSQTRIKRISDSSEITTGTGDTFNNFGPWYSNRQHWNSNNSKYIITAYRTGGDGNYTTPYGRNYWLFDDATDTPIHVLNNGTRTVSNQWRWSNTNPDELIFVDWTGTQTALEAMDVNTRAITTIKNFSPTYDLLSHDFCGGVGDPSIDGRYWALGVRKTGGAWFVICWDRVADSVLCEIPVPVQPGTSYLPAVTMSKSGSFIVISGTSAWTSGSTSVSRGLAIFNRSGVYLRSINQTGGGGATDIVGDHNAIGTDMNGNDIIIFFHDDGVGRAFCSFPLGQDQSGSPTRHTPYGMILGAMYVTPFAFGVNGHFVISDYPRWTSNSSFNTFPLRNHSWVAYADGSQVVYPLYESRFSMTDYSPSVSYLQSPWTTPNRNGTKFLFKSSMDTDWGAGSGGMPSTFHAFIAYAA